MYGKQTFSLAQDIGVSVGEAEEIVAKYLKSKPRVSDFISNTQDFLSANGYVDTLQGHRRILMGAFGDKKAHSDAMRQSVNTIN